jgi:hypothetical protein
MNYMINEFKRCWIPVSAGIIAWFATENGLIDKWFLFILCVAYWLYLDWANKDFIKRGGQK